MYAWRLGEVLPRADIAVLRGIEGARMKEIYRQLSASFGIGWRGRKYDRAAPDSADMANQAINHAATAVRAAAQVAVAVTGTIPQLGFIHEDSGISFALDVADLFRDRVTLPAAFSAVRQWTPGQSIERLARQASGMLMRKEKVVSTMIDRIKELFDGDDGGGDPERP
jgi:CRISPR-associated protein Cas1